MGIEVLDPESAKAIQEAAKFGAKAIDAGTGLAAYLDRVLGRIPDDLAGFLGDYLEHKRIRRAADLWAGTKEHLRKRGVTEPIDVSPSVLLPLIGAAVDEDRAGLKELWEALLASAMDPKRTDYVRPSLVTLLKQLDPLDAHVLRILTEGSPPRAGQDLAGELSTRLQVTRDDAWFTLEHLHELNCLDQSPNSSPYPRLSAKARLLIRVVGD